MILENTKEAPFLRKICSILEDQTYKAIIRWDPTKTMIHIISIQKMEDEILPKFFRHKKFPSFIRQLNLYGFKKVRKSPGNVFTHDKLLQGKEILSIISKKNQIKTESRQTIENGSKSEENRPEQKEVKRENEQQHQIQTQKIQSSQNIARVHNPNVCFGYFPSPPPIYQFTPQPQYPTQYYSYPKPFYNPMPYPSQHQGFSYDNYQYNFY